MPNDIPQTIVDRAYAVIDKTFQAAIRNQYGADFTAVQFEAEVTADIKNLLPQYSATDAPYILVSPDMEAVQGIAAQAIGKYEGWIGAGRPTV